jgi:3-oxoacyl-[acyl-carrier protein] reductase
VTAEVPSRMALVTGAARGIGLSTGLSLLALGHRVALVDRERVLDGRLPPANEGTLLTFEADVTDHDALRRVVAEASERLGPVEILVNNAAISLKNAEGRSNGILGISAEEWERTFSVNLTSVMRLCQLVLPAMQAAGWGRIVNMTSLAGRTASRVAGPTYMATKAGVIGLTRSIASEMGKSGITANCVAPGRILTEMAIQAGNEVNAQYAAQIPAGRLGTADEVAAAITYLCSEQAGFVNGAIIDINGGSFMP